MKEERENIRKELQELSPLLSKMKESGRAEGFDLPPAYFRELPDQVLEKIRKEERPATSRISWWQALDESLHRMFQVRYAAGLATVALLIIAAVLIFDRPEVSRSSSGMFNALTAEEVNTYIQSNLHEFEEDMVIEAAEGYQELSFLPGASLNEEALDEEYLEELLRELDEESIEELL